MMELYFTHLGYVVEGIYRPHWTKLSDLTPDAGISAFITDGDPDWYPGFDLSASLRWEGGLLFLRTEDSETNTNGEYVFCNPSQQTYNSLDEFIEARRAYQGPGVPAVVNMTPHPVVVFRGTNVLCTLEPSGVVARAEQADAIDFVLSPPGGNVGIAVVRAQFGKVDLPEPQEDTYYVVSAIVAQAAKAQRRSTKDLLLPSDLVRDDQNQVIGCRRFARL